MIEKLALVYIEIDVKRCSLEYGTLPCEAELGVTGDDKCFNTRNQRADCQDPANFSETTKTIRFGLRDVGYLPASIICLPLLRSGKVTNAVIKPGQSIGERASLTAKFFNGKHSDAGFDPYVTERGYIAYESGTFWGKFRARNTYLEGRPMRIIRGYVGQTLAEMDTEHFIIDRMDGPNSNGEVTIKATDFMKQLNSERALAPTPSSGRLSAEYLAGVSVVVLSPFGIGNDEYPASGRVAIGKEVFDFTRAADQLTLSPAMSEDHKLGEIAQQTLFYDAQKASVITADLIANYSPLDVSYTDEPAWSILVDQFANLLYTREVVKPTPTRTLINELVNQAGLVMFGDTRLQVVSFDVIRVTPSTGAIIDGEKILRDTFRQKDQPTKRFSQIVVYYDKRDDFASDEPENYFSAAVYIVPDDQYETPSILRIFSKWIRSESLSIAQNVAQRAAARYRFPPLDLRFSLDSDNTRSLGQIVTLSHPSIETATGSQGVLDAIITGVTNDVDNNAFVAEEFNLDSDSLEGDRVIQFDHDKNNIDLRFEYDSRFSSVDESPGAPDIIFIINTGVVIGSNSIATTSMLSGSWPVGVIPKLQIRATAFIVGHGGEAGWGSDGKDGGVAITATAPIDIDNQGTIGGGGGGGAGRLGFGGVGGALTELDAGEGGAGINIGQGVPPGTLETGSGGGLGDDGLNTATGGIYQGFTGGTAGNAVVGDSLIIYTNAGTILGNQIG